MSEADLLFTDDEAISHLCTAFSKIKSEHEIPIILFTGNQPDALHFPECVDDIITTPFSAVLWEKRLKNYLQLYQKKRKANTQNETGFETLFTKSHSVMLLIDPETRRIEDANPAACRFYGYPHDVLTQMKVSQINASSLGIIQEELGKAHSGEKSYFIFDHRLADGTIKTVEVNSEKITYKGKTVIFTIIHDITDKKETEKLLLETKENYQRVIENAPDIIVLIDRNGIIRYINQRIKDYDNSDPSELIGVPFTSFLPPDETDRAIRALERVFEKRQTGHYFSTWLTLKNGKKIPVLTKGVLVKFTGEDLNLTLIRDISYLKKAEQRLQQSKEAFERIFNNHSVAIYVQDKTGKFLDVNQAALKLYKLKHKKDLLGKTPEVLSAKEKNKNLLIEDYIERAWNGEPCQFEFWGKRTDGTIFPKLVSIERGIYYGKDVIFAFSFDMTLLKKAEEQLKESEEKFNSIFNSSPFPANLINKDFEIVLANRRLLEMRGVTLDEIKGKKCYSFFMGKQGICDNCPVKEVFEKKHSVNKTDSVFLPDGEKKYFRISAYPIFDTDHNIKYVVENTVDITDQKVAEEQLRESITNYRLLFEKAPFAILTTRPDGTILDANPKLLEIIGSPSVEETKKINILQFPPLIKTGYTKHFKDCLETGKTIRFKTEYTSKWGKKLVAENIFVPLKNEKGIIQKVYIILRDITEQYQAEKLLMESEEKYHSIFRTSIDAIAINEFITGRYLEINESFKTILGFKSDDEILGKTDMELQVWARQEDREKMVEQLKRTGFVKNQEVLFRGRNNQMVIGLISAQLISVHGKKYIVNETRDITDLKKAEQALRESQELFQTLANISPTGIFRTNAKGKTTYVNPKWSEITGYSIEKALNQGWIDILHPEDKDELIHRWEKRIAAHDYSQERFRIVRPDGTVRWVLGHAAPEFINGRFAGYVGTITDITDIVETEESLRESENKYRSLAETSSDLILTFDTEGKFTFLSPSLKKMTGYEPEETINKYFWEFVAPEYVESTIKKFKRGVEGETIPLYEIELLKKNGERLPVELNVTSLYDAKGKIKGRLAVVRDISERKKAEQALKESEARLQRFSEITTEGIVIHKNSVIVDANQTFLKITGYTLEELKGCNVVKKLAHPDSYSIIYQNIKKKYAKPYEIKIFKKDGSLLPVEITAIDYTDASGEISRAVVFHDITERLKMEKAIRESEQKYREQSRLFRLMSDNIPDLVWAKDLENRFIFSNKANAEKLLLANDVKEPIGKTDSYFAERQRRLHPNDDKWFTFDLECSDSDKKVLSTKKAIRSLETGYVKGKFLALDVFKAPIFDENGNLIGTVGHGRDVTKEIEAERAIRLRDKALNAAANAIVITDANGKIEWINRAFTTLTGYSIEEAVGHSTGDLINSGKQDKDFYDVLDKTLKAGKVWKGEIVDRRKDGSLYVVEEIITPVTNDEGKVEHLIGIMTDITERKAAERELLAAKEAAEESSRLKSAFLANMNHEIRTPMNAIMGFSDLMIDARSSEVMKSYAKIVSNSSRQLLNLIDDVIFLSRLQSEKLPVKKIAFRPADVVKEIFEMFNLPEMKNNLELRTTLPENANDILFYADDYKIKQVLTNFVSNAIKYTPEGFINLGFNISQNKITFFVEDSGIGIDENEQALIFDAFYRGERAVSAAVRGTGLGLNIAKGLVELMGGTIGVKSKPNQGSRFYFTLDYEQPEKKALKSAQSPEYKIKERKDLSLLIVEDDETNYLYMEVLLKDKVKNIDHATNGREAIEMAEKNQYDLVFMDIKMPILSGDEATRKIKKQHPGLPVVATTAYATQEEKERALEAGCDAYLSKPIQKEDLYAVIDKLISGKPD
ncbi:PAS domain S-box protein [Candidatus Sulfidibacterium hydrothermale]|uniref:PAS domain S-box protein n=1 Tax=Candidatus Sulfidibacterium hydrothermale TaxID=2875962 RepID=UPI001F0A464D|nr:PAS domain S-box protein [Candidatus Sulfidibacterium hydrothermale]UBM62940.1 PAS domain S-box protein [Candidatus Sulfidibacterium hydrothermale]